MQDARHRATGISDLPDEGELAVRVRWPSDSRPRVDGKLAQLAVHCAWLPARDAFPARLAIWGESAIDHQLPPRRGRKPTLSLSRPRPHPFAATLDQLRAVFSAASSQPDDPPPEEAGFVARLPSADGAPCPSPDLAVDSDSARSGPLELASWEMEGLALPPEQGLEFLLSLADSSLGEDAEHARGPTHDAAAEVTIGEDVRFWILAARISLELIYRQRLVPTLVRDGNRYLQGVAPGDRGVGGDPAARADPRHDHQTQAGLRSPGAPPGEASATSTRRWRRPTAPPALGPTASR